MADYTQDELRAEAIRRGLLPADNASAAPSDGGLLAHGDTSNSFGFMSHPIENTMRGVHAAQDFGGGLMGGVQRTGAALSGLLEYPVHAAYEGITGNKVPHYNTRELWGLEGDQPVDLNKMISHNPDSLMSKIGQFAPAIAAGGANLGRQALTNGLWGAAQADPNQTNLGGILPNGPIGAGIQDAATATAVGGAFKYGPSILGKGVDKVKDLVNYLSPDKDAASFLQRLGNGTKEENVQALAKEIDDAYQSKLQDALSHKKPVFDQEGGSHIFDTPASKLPEGNLDKVAYYIAPGEKTTPEQLTQLSKEIKNFRAGKVGKEPYTFDDFTDNVQDIFNTEMKPVQIKNLEHALNIPTTSESKFMTLANKNPELLAGDTGDLFEKFSRKPTLNNADELQSQLGADMGTYSTRAQKMGLTKGEGAEQKKLKDMRDALKADMQSHLTRVDPKLADEYTTYSQKYRDNVVPYQEEKATQTIANEPGYIKKQRQENPSLPYNVTSSQMKTAFAEPSRQAQQIATDLGQSGRNKILYNFLADESKPDAKGLANALKKAKQAEGYQTYITPDMDTLADQLLKRTKLRKAALWGLGGLAGSVGAGLGYDIAKKII